MVQSQPRQIVRKTLSQKTLHKNRAGGVAQSEGPEFNPQYWKTNKQTNKQLKPCPRSMVGGSAGLLLPKSLPYTISAGLQCLVLPSC
jgi:hypothetical protein